MAYKYDGLTEADIYRLDAQAEGEDYQRELEEEAAFEAEQARLAALDAEILEDQ